MFGHLKGKNYIDAMEGAEFTKRQRSHLEACASCRQTWESLQAVHTDIISLDTDIPEPDWAEFRTSVRDGLLSRSIQRETVVRRWTGWAIRPAMAWALSLFLAVGLTSVAFLWNSDRTAAPQQLTPDTSIEAIEAGPDKSLIDDMVQLGDEQQEQLRELLESAQKTPQYRQ